MNGTGQHSVRRPVPVLVTLANAGRPRRPKRARRGSVEPVFGSLQRAREFLAPLGVAGTLDEPGLRPLAALAGELSAIAGALAHRAPPPAPKVINALAAQAKGHRRLEITGLSAKATTEWEAPTAAADLARRVIEELATLDAGRLKECARPECTLVFYDLTRPNTQRWHAEDPCGWHERQVRHRSKTTGGNDPDEDSHRDVPVKGRS
jgi:CGNR zinc finger